MTFPPRLRSIFPLDGLWDFAFLGKIDLARFDPSEDRAWERVLVPSAFDATPTYSGQRGAAVYRTKFRLPAGQAGRLSFGAVSLWSRVYVDGTLLHEWACGYAPFSVEVPPTDQEEFEMIVLVDNRFDFERVPMHEDYFDFYQYGGILRSVVLQVLPRTWIESVQITAGQNYQNGEVKISITLGGEGGISKVGLQLDSGEVQIHDLPTVAAVVDAKVLQPRLWSPTQPHLHWVNVTLREENGEVMDDLPVKFGLRKVEAREGAIWLNGEHLILKGYNRHEWHPNFGPCTPILQMAGDLEWMRKMGCNFVRGSHYPQDQKFLDLCDELGFLVWEENLGWGQTEKSFSSEKFRKHHRAALENMVKASFNHPSVIIWGFLNEAISDQEESREIFEETVSTLRAMDPSRLISYASNRPRVDKYFHLVDVISLNLYPGWYECEGVENPVSLIAPFLSSTVEWLDAQGWKDKPLLLSEIGAEGLYGWHEAHNDFFSEEYQARYLRTASDAVLGNPRWSGLALWHFSDVRTYGGGWSMRRPRTFNNKGTLDEYRRPKAAFVAVREAFSEAFRGIVFKNR